MSKQKHTPGPWEVIVGEECCFHEGNRVSVIKRTNDGGEEQNTTVVEIWPTSDDTDIADARLIAAAPELLEKGKQAIRLLEIHEAIAMSRHSEDCSCALCELKRTIAKAEGTD